MDFGYNVIVPIINVFLRMLNFGITVFGVYITVKSMIVFMFVVTLIALFLNYIRG